jgi:polysaccharide pyruvyl transferase WcaK-like protein
VRNVEEWLARTRDVDAMIGFRFHGNMIALLQGKPCFYWTYDSRLAEFAELYALPHQDVTAPWTDPLQAMLDHDWDRTNARIRALYAELKAFYAENGFDHALS